MTSMPATTNTGRGFQLLIVDDDRIVQQLYADLLARQAPAGCTIRQAADGAAGLAALRAHTFDCVLLDFRLPDMNGLDFLAHAAIDGVLPCAFVLLTAQGSEATAVEAMKRGVQDYLVKGLMDIGRLWGVVEGAATQVSLHHDLARAARDLERRSAELVRSNDALARSEARFRALVEAAPNAFVVTNAAGLIEMVNAQTERLFGYPRAELLGAPVEMLLPTRLRLPPPESGSAVFQPASHPIAPPPARFGLRRDGSQVELEIGLSFIETEEGTMVLSAIVDISDRVRLEQEIRQSQKMHAIGRVTAGVAHDFNNLLQALGGSLELLIEAVADRPEAVQWGEAALRATERGSELTSRLLSFSRKRMLMPLPVMIDGLFSDLKGLISHLFQTTTGARTELVMMPGKPGLAVLADQAQLEAALINLAVNARDAMAGGGVLRISAYQIDADPAIVPSGRYTVISVADTGSGMDANTLAQACEPFFTTKGAKGTGLGLSMVQGFARQSGGEAHIASVVGEGTTIDLWLPSVSLPAMVEATETPPARTVGRVLLVDDFQDALLVVSAFLRHAGLGVTSRTSGELALAELAAGKRFDAIITDFAMPGMNGLELLALAREFDPAMACMMITGFADPGLPAELDDVVVLRKPFNRAELTTTVHQLIAAKHAATLPLPVTPAA